MGEATGAIRCFDPLYGHGRVFDKQRRISVSCSLYRGNYESGRIWSSRAKLFHSRQQDASLRSHFTFQPHLVNRRSTVVAASSKDSDEGSTSTHKSLLSIIFDLLGFLLRIPGLFGFFKKQKKFVEDIGDQVEDASEVVEDIAEVVENIAEAISKVAGGIADDARDTQELMDKVQETTKAVHSDIGEAIENLEEAFKSENPVESEVSGKDIRKASKAASRAAEKAESVKDVATQAAEKAQKVKEAASELEKTSAGVQTDEEVEGSKGNMDDAPAAATATAAAAAAPGGKENKSVVVPQQKYQRVSSSGHTKFVVLALFFALFALAFSSWLPQVVSSTGMLKYLVDSVR